MNCECRDYDDLRAALRQRAEELNISRMEIDRVSGLPNGYSAAVLSETANKRLSAENDRPSSRRLGAQARRCRGCRSDGPIYCPR